MCLEIFVQDKAWGRMILELSIWNRTTLYCKKRSSISFFSELLAMLEGNTWKRFLEVPSSNLRSITIYTKYNFQEQDINFSRNMSRTQGVQIKTLQYLRSCIVPTPGSGDQGSSCSLRLLFPSNNWFSFSSVIFMLKTLISFIVMSEISFMGMDLFTMSEKISLRSLHHSMLFSCQHYP